MRKTFTLIAFCFSFLAFGQRTETLLKDNWKFIKGDPKEAGSVNFDDKAWENISIPHDWAIKGPFDKKVDMQISAIKQDGEVKATEKTGRTGALPFIGVGWYRYHLFMKDSDVNKQVLLQFDGAMSEAQVFINGRKVGEHPNGYAYFYFDITKYLSFGKDNLIAVRLQNKERSSRWYPGAGLYRNVRLITKNKTSIRQWGTTITTPIVGSTLAKVNIITALTSSGNLHLETSILDSSQRIVAKQNCNQCIDSLFSQCLSINNPKLWSPEHPYMYSADIKLYDNNKLVDHLLVPFGVRSIQYISEKGFLLNGKKMKFKGVCLHHDLGPLGAAINQSALKRELLVMKRMGANAIRTSHNMPSFEELELCDELGLMVIAESFDEWGKAKIDNGYHRFFDKWAKIDVENLVRATKNHPSIVMWSAGNEVPDQSGDIGRKRLYFLQSIFHQEDSTRPVTVGMNQVKSVLKNGFASIIDIPGINYHVSMYEEAHQLLPQGMILGSETASAISSRGVYKFPVKEYHDKKYPDSQCSAYGLEACPWANIPDDDFAVQDDNSWTLGQFVWTGFDYLGEPTPYYEQWPSRSSYFGICDLAGIPKDRYYLYKSKWNIKVPTLHILPHWTWPGREGKVTPVFVYSSYNKVELFLNGKSLGIREKDSNSRLDRYRFRWNDVIYHPGELKAVAYDDKGNEVMTQKVVTSGNPDHLLLKADRTKLNSDGQDISFVTVTVVDKKGNTCPNASIKLNFSVKGAGHYKAACNGDATSLELFHLPHMTTFNGKLVVLVQSLKQAGLITLNVTGRKIKKASIKITSENINDKK